MRINLEDNKGQIITSVEIQEDDTLERDIDGFYKRRDNDKAQTNKEGAVAGKLFASTA